MPFRSLLTTAALSALCVAATLAPRPSRAAAGAGSTMAVEDTMRTSVPEVLVRAPRVTLEEILARVARGEARRESLITDMAFTATVRLVRNTLGPQPPHLYLETVARAYKKKPDKVRSVVLREWRDRKQAEEKKDHLKVEADFSPSMGEDIVNFAFKPEARREYRYRIAGRDILGDHLIYRISFEPRSALAVYKPSGQVWVDTHDFVILRQEVEFRQSPVPLFMKGIRRMVVERQRVGNFWVLDRVMARVEMTLPMPEVGRAFDFGLRFSDYAINTGLPDSVFATGAAVLPGRERAR